MIHREGRKTLFIALILLGFPYVILDQWVHIEPLTRSYLVLALVIYLFILQFFRRSEEHTSELQSQC